MEATKGETQQASIPDATVQMSTTAALAVQSASQLSFTRHDINGWEIHWSSYPMSNSIEMEAAQDQIATMGLPEVFYGNNHVYLAKPEFNFLLEVCPVDAISYSSYAKRESHLRDAQSQASVEVGVAEDDKLLNLIDIIPQSMKVQ